MIPMSLMEICGCNPTWASLLPFLPNVVKAPPFLQKPFGTSSQGREGKLNIAGGRKCGLNSFLAAIASRNIKYSQICPNKFALKCQKHSVWKGRLEPNDSTNAMLGNLFCRD